MKKYWLWYEKPIENGFYKSTVIAKRNEDEVKEKFRNMKIGEIRETAKGFFIQRVE